MANLTTRTLLCSTCGGTGKRKRPFDPRLWACSDCKGRGTFQVTFHEPMTLTMQQAAKLIAQAPPLTFEVETHFTPRSKP